MALLISLSLLWASSTVYADVGDSAASNWTWKLKCCASNKSRFTLEIVAQTLKNCSSPYSSEKCFDTYKQSESVNFSLRVGNGSITWSENNTVCEQCNTQPKCHPNITVNKQPRNFAQGKNDGIYWTSQNRTKVNINFKCAVNNLNLVLQNTNKSWIDALEECQKNHSSLVELSTDAMRDKVKSLLQNESSQRGVWIGLERSVFGYNAEWKWISGSTIGISQLNQSVNAKNDYNNHCGMIFNASNQIAWQDANCHDNLPFICQSPVWNRSPCASNVAIENSELSIDIEEESGSNSYEECK